MQAAEEGAIPESESQEQSADESVAQKKSRRKKPVIDEPSQSPLEESVSRPYTDNEN